jgi:hypothetical protein
LAYPQKKYPSAEYRLPASLHFAESDAIGGVVRARSVHKVGYGHNGVRGITLGRKSWLFCGSDRGGERAAVMYSLIVSAKMNDIDPQAWLADVLARIAEHPIQRLDELLPWNWRKTIDLKRAAA